MDKADALTSAAAAAADKLAAELEAAAAAAAKSQQEALDAAAAAAAQAQSQALEELAAQKQTVRRCGGVAAPGLCVVGVHRS